jgi:hypothetical protein
VHSIPIQRFGFDGVVDPAIPVSRVPAAVHEVNRATLIVRTRVDLDSRRDDVRLDVAGLVRKTSA